MFAGGAGNDTLSLGSDSEQDTVLYTYGDRSDTLHQFVRGAGGDVIAFSDVAVIDVITISTRTESRSSDGNAGGTREPQALVPPIFAIT